jgi:hypothetical protein
MVAHPVGGLFFLANETAESLSRKIPPICPLASRATQNPSMLRPMKNAGIVSLTMPGSSGRNCAAMVVDASADEMPECSPSGAISAVKRSGICCGERSGLVSGTAIIARLSIAIVCPGDTVDECARPARPPVASGK